MVAELRDPELADGQLRGEKKRSEQVRGKRMAALQTAVLEAAAEHGLKTMITFHHRTMEAEAWAAGLPGVAAKLHAMDPARYPARRLVWAGWLHGEHEAEHRREVLRQFGDRVDRHGRPVRRAVLSNCRVLGEGVDVPAVDSVAIIDPKGSVVDIVQAIGRALRQKPRQGKMATIVVPVFLEHGESPEEMYASGSYRPLVNVMQALRAHDSKMVEMLAVPQDHTSPVEPSESIGTAPAEGEEEQRILLRFSARRSPEAIRRFVDMQVINPVRETWARGYAAAARYAGEHGNLRVPLTYREPGSDYPLGRWISDQRTEYAAGRMEDAEGRERKRRLNEIGMVWSAPDLAWEENLAAARSYFAEHGTLCAPQGAAAAGKPVGQWLTNLRRPGGLGKDPIRATQRHADLAAIDPEWNPRELGWTVDWQRHYIKVKTCLDGGATVEELAVGVRVGGEDVGRWLKRQQESWGTLNAEQQRRLRELGVAAAVRPPEARTAPPKGGARAAAFERGLAAARQYREREGTLDAVPRKHIETIAGDGGGGADAPVEHQVRLGVWLTNIKTRRGSLTPERAAALNELGLRWT